MPQQPTSCWAAADTGENSENSNEGPQSVVQKIGLAVKLAVLYLNAAGKFENVCQS